MGKNIIQTRNLSKKYKDGFAVNSLNMTLEQGAIYGLIGQNGAGKTTLIRMLMGLVRPTSGEIAIWEKTDDSSLLKGRQRIGSIIETPAIYSNMTAQQNLEMVRIQRGIPGKDCINYCLKEVDLVNTGDKMAGKFSLGMKQRLAIAMALLSEPELLILDEPVNGLDPVGIVQIREMLKRINRERGVTILISSHILSEVYQMATCYGIMNKGLLIEELSADALNKKSRKYIEIKVDNSAKAATIIDRELATPNYEIFPDNCIRLYDHVENPGMVNMKLTENMVFVESIMTVGDNLEDYFLRVTGGGKSA